MSYDAGSIVASVDLDRTPFQQGLRLLRQEAHDFERTGVTPSADLDTTKADRKVTEFRTRLERIAATKATAQVAVENGQAVRALIDTSDRLDKLRATVATARADVDDQRAKDKLDALDLQLRRVGLITSRPKVTLDGVQRANLQLDAMAAKLAILQRTGGGGSGGGRSALTGGSGPGFFGSLASHAPSFMSLGLGAAIPAALPLAGLAAGAGAALLTPISTGLAGLVPFVAAASASVKTVEKDVKTLTTLQTQYNAATTNKQRAAVLAKEHALWSSLDPAQRKAVKNVQGLDESWARFQKRLQPQTFGALAAGVGVVNTMLKDALPVSKAVGKEIISLEDRAGKAFKDPFWHDFFTKFLAKEAPRAIDTLGVSAGHFFTGLAHLTEDFAPLGHDFEAMLVRWSTRFEHWTEGQGPGKFVAWVEKNGPQAAHALGALAHGVEGIGKGLFPIGQVELRAFTPVLDFIGKLGDEHPAVITAIGTALLGVGAGLKVIAGVKGITTVLGGIRGLRGGGGFGGAGGVASKLDPVPVFVTNEGFGGPGGPGGKGTSGKPPGVLGRVAKVLPNASTLALAYLATQGGDQARGQTPLGASNIRNGPAITSLIAGVGPRIPMHQGQDFFTGSVDQPGGRPVNPTALVSNTLGFGTAQQIKQLQALARTYPAISAALKDYNQQQSNLNQLLIVGPGLAKNAAAANGIISKSIRGVTAAVQNQGLRAYAAGGKLGQDILNGLLAGMKAKTPAAVFQAKLTTSSILRQMAAEADSHSPSRKTQKLGVDLAAGLAIGINKGTPQAVAAAQKLVAQVAARFVTLQGNVKSTEQGLIGSLLGQTGLGAFTTQTDALGNAVAPTTHGIILGLRHQKSALATLRERLHREERHGLSPGAERQIIGLGLDQGGAYAASLSHATRRQLRSVSHLLGDVHSEAVGTARDITGDIYGPRIADLLARIAQLTNDNPQSKKILAELTRLTDRVESLAHEVRGVQHRAASRTSKP